MFEVSSRLPSAVGESRRSFFSSRKNSRRNKVPSKSCPLLLEPCGVTGAGSGSRLYGVKQVHPDGAGNNWVRRFIISWGPYLLRTGTVGTLSHRTPSSSALPWALSRRRSTGEKNRGRWHNKGGGCATRYSSLNISRWTVVFTLQSNGKV